MGQVSTVQITHCCTWGCLSNRYGRHSKCPVCGSNDVNYHTLYHCGGCGRDHEREDSAEDCCPDSREEAETDE